MVAKTLLIPSISIVYLLHVSFGIEISGLPCSVTMIDLITSKVQTGDCYVPLDNLAFSACDRRKMDLNAVNSVFFRDEMYLCMGVYDVVLHICSLEKNNQNLTNSIQEIMEEMDAEDKSETYGVKNICISMKTIKFEAASHELEPWLSKLNNTLQEDCENTCIKKSEVNPLCIFVLWGNTLRLELKVEKENVADMNVNTSKLLKKADEKTIIVQPSDKILSQHKIQPSSTVEHTSININELDGNHNKPEEVTNKRQEDLPVVDGQSYNFNVKEDQGNKLNGEPKISTSAESDTKESLTTLSSNEALQHLETGADITNFGEDGPNGDMPSITLSEPPATSWKITSFTINDFVEQTDQFPANQEEENDSGLPSVYRKHFDNVEDPHFFAYFMAVVVICIIGYLIYHNKHKFLALILEGRRRREMRRRTAHGGYRKLDSSLEEAVTSTCSTSVTHVIY